MTVDQAVELSRSAVMLALVIGAPLLAVAVVVGLLMSILQAVTQLQDQTLSFVPKIIAVMITLIVVLPWTIQRMVEYAGHLIRDIPTGL